MAIRHVAPAFRALGVCEHSLLHYRNFLVRNLHLGVMSALGVMSGHPNRLLSIYELSVFYKLSKSPNYSHQFLDSEEATSLVEDPSEGVLSSIEEKVLPNVLLIGGQLIEDYVAHVSETTKNSTHDESGRNLFANILGHISFIT